MTYRISLVLAIIITVCLSIVSPVSAHGRTPRLEISVGYLNPGGVLDIRGVEFDYEELVTLYLERQGIAVSLGEITADLEGIFIHTIVLPSDLPIGAYSIRGVTEHHDVISPTFTVQGAAVSTEELGRGEREALIVPVPTHAPGVNPGAVVQPTQVAGPVSAQTPVSRASPMLMLGLSIFLVLAVFLVFRRNAIVKG
jgi:hypothetical protein